MKISAMLEYTQNELIALGEKNEYTKQLIEYYTHVKLLLEQEILKTPLNVIRSSSIGDEDRGLLVGQCPNCLSTVIEFDNRCTNNPCHQSLNWLSLLMDKDLIDGVNGILLRCKVCDGDIICVHDSTLEDGTRLLEYKCSACGLWGSAKYREFSRRGK